MRARALCMPLFAVACRAATPTPDAPTYDAVVADVVAPLDVVDAPTVDARSDTPDVPVLPDLPDVTDIADAPPDDPCAPGRVIDLDATGTRTGATTRISGTNASAGRLTTLDAPCAAGMTGYVVVYRYTPRARGRLRITTNHEGTAARLDTVVFAMSACGGGRSLGCGDDTGDPPRDHASTFVTDEDVSSGAPVFIAVGGFRHATQELWDSQGTFVLTVTEQALE